MVDVNELELVIAKTYATKVDLGKLEGRIESVDKRVEAVNVSVGKQDATMSLMQYKLDGILGVLNRLFWLVATPIISGAVGALIWVAIQASG